MRKISRTAVGSCAAVILLLLLSGCTQKPIDPTFVAQRWSETLAAFNIDPVFPPRMMNVGDVFLVLVPPEGFVEDPKAEYSRRSMKLTHQDVSAQLRANYLQYLQLPGTSDLKPTADIFSPPKVVTHLPLTAYPGFNIVNITQGDIGLAFPIYALKAFFGFAGSNSLAASISIPNAEDVELPGLDAYNAVRDFCNSPQLNGAICFSNSLRFQSLMNQIYRPTDPPNLQPYLLFVTHVYYASSIDYSYSTSNAFAVSAAVTAKATAAQSASKSTSGAPSSANTASTTGAVPAISNTVTITGLTATSSSSTPGASSSCAPAAAGAPVAGAPAAGAPVAGAPAAGAPAAGAPAAGAHAAGAPPAGAGKTPSSADNCASKPATEQAVTTTTPAASPEATAQKELQDVQAQLTALQQQLSSLNAGGSATIGTVTDEGTFLRQTFSTPVAIGYRAFWIKPKVAPYLPPGY